MTTTTSLVTNTGGNVYTSTGNTVITWLSITNYTANTASANVHLLGTGQSANLQNMIAANVSITGGDTFQIYTFAEKLVLENATTIYVIANIDATLNAVTSYTSA